MADDEYLWSNEVKIEVRGRGEAGAGRLSIKDLAKAGVVVGGLLGAVALAKKKKK